MQAQYDASLKDLLNIVINAMAMDRAQFMFYPWFIYLFF